MFSLFFFVSCFLAFNPAVFYWFELVHAPFFALHPASSLRTVARYRYIYTHIPGTWYQVYLFLVPKQTTPLLHYFFFFFFRIQLAPRFIHQSSKQNLACAAIYDRCMQWECLYKHAAKYRRVCPTRTGMPISTPAAQHRQLNTDTIKANINTSTDTNTPTHRHH